MLSVLEKVILIVVISVSAGLFAFAVSIRIRLLRTGTAANRFDRIGARLKFAFSRVLSQLCCIKDRPITGIMHAFVFWGFAFFLIATINHVGAGLSEGFSIFGKTQFGLYYFLVVDIIAVLTIIGILALTFRRYILRPEGIAQPMPISKSPHSAVVIILIFSLMVTYLFNKGFEQAIAHNSSSLWTPISSFIGSQIAKTDVRLGTLHIWNRALWWLHILIILGFLVFIPFSKHLHLIAGPINIFFRNLKPLGILEPIDIEKAEYYGVAKINQYSWKSLLDLFSCIECGRCQDNCPAWLSDKPLSPKVLIMNLHNHILDEKRNLLKGGSVSKPIMDDWVTPDEIWACTTCGGCQEACPVKNEHIEKILDLRRDRVLMESQFPPELNTTFRGLENNSNPWGIGWTTRGDWASDLEVKILSEEPACEYLWFVGCAGAFDDRVKKVSQALVKILNSAGVHFAILGPEEKCCGDPSRRLGNEYLFQMSAQENIEIFKSYNARKIITACPHCYNMIKNEYPQFGGEFEVYHHTEVIADLIKNGRLKFRRRIDVPLTYHDSCYLGRYNDIYDQPRAILKSLSKTNFIEMKRSRNKSFCCGAGGGRMWMEETTGKRINHIRTEEIVNTSVNIAATACPFCLTMIEDGIKDKAVEGSLEVMDLAELIQNCL